MKNAVRIAVILLVLLSHSYDACSFSRFNQEKGFSLNSEFFAADDYKEKNFFLSNGFELGKIETVNFSGEVEISGKWFGERLNLPGVYSVKRLNSAGAAVNANINDFSFSAGINSPSDKIFNSNREILWNTGIMYDYNIDKKKSWKFGLNYISRGKYRVFPVIAYQYFGDKFLLMFPLFCQYNISDKLFANLGAEGMNGFGFSLNYKLQNDMTASAFVKITDEEYFISDRTKTDEWLSIEKKSLGLRLSKKINNIDCGVYAGYLFSSKYFCEDDDSKYFRDKISDSMFGGFSISGKF